MLVELNESELELVRKYDKTVSTGSLADFDDLKDLAMRISNKVAAKVYMEDCAQGLNKIGNSE